MEQPRPIVVLDFGAQYSQLIARRVRELQVYSVIVPCTIPFDELLRMNPQALILSGGPSSVYDTGSPTADDRIFKLNIPILGISTILCTVIALAFRLNLPAIQIVQAAMAPTQLLLIIPFVRLGEWILRVPNQPLSIKEGLDIVAQGAGHAIVVLWDAILHAGFAWILVAPIAVLLFYKLLTPVFERAAAQIK